MTKRYQPEPELTVKQVAKLLGITPNAVLGLIGRGHFPNAHADRERLGPRAPFYIPQSEVDAELVRRQEKKRHQSQD